MLDRPELVEYARNNPLKLSKSNDVKLIGNKDYIDYKILFYHMNEYINNKLNNK